MRGAWGLELDRERCGGEAHGGDGVRAGHGRGQGVGEYGRIAGPDAGLSRESNSWLAMAVVIAAVLPAPATIWSATARTATVIVIAIVTSATVAAFHPGHTCRRITRERC
jgi:hypothetical protein